MRKLTSYSGRLEDGRVWHVYDVLDKKVRVIDDFANAMLIGELFDDKALDDSEKTSILTMMVLPDVQAFAEAFGEQTSDAFAQVMMQAFGIDVKGGVAEKRVLDWEEDAARIKATMRSAYGLGEEFMGLPYLDVCELLGMAPQDTPMGQALYYRTADKPKRTKYNKEQISAFEKARDFYKLGKKKTTIERANATATSMFDAIAGGSDGRRPGND